MKVSELRIGNWILHNGTLVKVMPSSYYLLNIWEAELKKDVDFKPILLTEEWMEKFGFIFNKLYDCWCIDAYFIYFIKDEIHFCKEINDGADFEVDTVLAKPKYVHKLQNLYYELENKELTTK